jgi:trimeric autotransporter adhesin
LSQIFKTAQGSSSAIISPTNGGTGVSNPPVHTVAVAEGAAPFNFVGPGTAGQVLQSRGPAADPSYSTAIYPTTSTINQIVYSSAANNITGLATANDGTLVTSNTGVPSILAGPGTTGNILQSNAAAAPSFSSSTYPSSTTINQVLYSSSNNVVSGLPTLPSGVLTTSAAGVPAITAILPTDVQSNITSLGTITAGVWNGTTISPVYGGTGISSPTAHTLPVAEGASNFNFLGPLTNGQLLIGSTGNDPVAATLTGGTGISIVNTAGVITINSTGGDTWTAITASQTLAINNGYICISPGGALSLALPAVAPVGSEFEVTLDGATSWTITQGAGQSIRLGTSVTTVGVAGSLASTAQGNSVRFICSVANTRFNVLSSIGNITVV